MEPADTSVPTPTAAVPGGLRRAVMGTFGVKVASTFFSFVLNFIVARLLGPAGNGYFSIAQSASVLGTTLGKLGLDSTTVRFVASPPVPSASPSDVVRAVLRLSAPLCLAASAGIYFAAPWLAQLLQEGNGKDLAQNEWIVRLAAWSIVPYAVSTLVGQALVGAGRAQQGVATQLLAMPLVGCVLSAVLIPLYGVDGAVWAFTLSAFAAVGVGAWSWWSVMRFGPGVRVALPWKLILASCLPLFWMSLVQYALKWSPTVLLKMWASVEDVGVFNVAIRTAFLQTFILIAVNASVGPSFSRLYAAKDFEAMGQLARRSGQIMALIALVPLLLFVAFPNAIMGLFGQGFAAGGTTLAVVAVGQYVNVFTGSVQQLLVMSGQERLLGWIFTAMVPPFFALMVWLVPLYGALGAGIATAVVMVGQNVACAVVVRRHLGVRTIPTPLEIARTGLRLARRRGRSVSAP